VNSEKKQLRICEDPGHNAEGHSIEAFHHRLRDLCGHDGQSAGSDRSKRAENEAQQAHALARELEILRKADQTFEEFKNSNPELAAALNMWWSLMTK
jgi:hypothetical protein